MNCVRAAWLGLLTGALACSPAHAIYNMSAFYSPSAWRPLPTTDAPSPRFGHVAVWSGTYFVVWGGRDPVGPTVHNDGARFATTAVWDEGTDMIVWGGLDSSGSAKLNTGAKYNVGTNTWNAVTTTSAPTARDGHAAVFCDGKMVIWGGTDTTSVAVNTGGLYDISLGTWTATNPSGPPPGARNKPTAICATFSGYAHAIFWGGYGGGARYNTGGRLRIGTNAWTSTSTTGAPSERSGHSAVWTGTEMIVWGGDDNGTPYYNDGGRYNPVADSWTTMSLVGAPAPRTGHVAVWTGTEMIIWGGFDGTTYFRDGAAYNPTNNTWRPLNLKGVPEGRLDVPAAWTPEGLMLFGGQVSGMAVGGGALAKP